MVVIFAITRYRCPQCDQTYSVGQSNVPAGIFTALNRIDKNKTCHLCHTKLIIDNIRCKVIKNIYGDTNFGFWVCRTHSNRQFYPNPMKQAMENKSLKAFPGMASHYMMIAKTGFPWRCPLCTQDLAYKDERCTGAIC